MESKKEIEVIKSKVTIFRGDKEANDDTVKLIFSDLDSTEVNLNDSTVDDIKNLFDVTFEYINTNQKLIEFELDDNTEDLFKQVSSDVIAQINSEISEAKQNFARIWELAAKTTE